MINEREFLERAHLDRGTLEIWIREEWLVPSRAAPEPSFTEMDLARAAPLLHPLALEPQPFAGVGAFRDF